MTPSKKEIVIGFVSIVLIVLMVIFFVASYSSKLKLNYPNNLTAPPPAQTQEPVRLSIEEVAKHASDTSCWFIVNNKVYDVTGYFNHPGGRERIIGNCGRDATQIYQSKDGKGSHSAEAQQLLLSYYIGDINSMSRILPTRSIDNTSIKNNEEEDDD